MDIIKYFYEEPASLDVLTPDEDPDARQWHAPSGSVEAFLAPSRYRRGYLAGSNLSDGRVGLTAVGQPEAFVSALMDWLGGHVWMRGGADGHVDELRDVDAERLWCDPGDTAVLVCAAELLPGETVSATRGLARRRTLSALRRLLDAAGVVCFPEPAHHGFDWSFFSTRPLREPVEAAFRRHLREDVRCFVLPYQEARSEERFYFEQYDLERYARYEVKTPLG